MQQSNIDQYVDYFKNLAICHSALRHNPLAETGDAAMGESHFCKWNAKEIIGGLRSQVSFPALIIQIYETDLGAEVEFDIRKKCKGGFAIVTDAKQSNFASEQEAYRTTEIILHQILQQIWKDHYKPGTTACKTPFKLFDFNSISIVPTGQLFENHFGWNVEFDFTFHNTLNISQEPDNGVFDNYIVLGDDTGWLGFENHFLGNTVQP